MIWVLNRGPLVGLLSKMASNNMAIKINPIYIPILWLPADRSAMLDTGSSILDDILKGP